MTDKQFATALEHIGQIKGHLDGYKAITKPLEDELEMLKLQVMEHMHETRSKRTEAANGYYVVRAERQSLTVTDPAAVEGWLTENGFDLEEYKKLDAARVTATAKSALEQNGELVPGIGASSTEYLTIKAA